MVLHSYAAVATGYQGNRPLDGFTLPSEVRLPSLPFTACVLENVA